MNNLCYISDNVHSLHPGDRRCIIWKRFLAAAEEISVFASYFVAQEYLRCILCDKCCTIGSLEAKSGEGKLHRMILQRRNKSDMTDSSHFAMQEENEILTDNFMAG